MSVQYTYFSPGCHTAPHLSHIYSQRLVLVSCFTIHVIRNHVQFCQPEFSSPLSLYFGLQDESTRLAACLRCELKKKGVNSRILRDTSRVKLAIPPIYLLTILQNRDRLVFNSRYDSRCHVIDLLPFPPVGISELYHRHWWWRYENGWDSRGPNGTSSHKSWVWCF